MIHTHRLPWTPSSSLHGSLAAAQPVRRCFGTGHRRWCAWNVPNPWSTMLHRGFFHPKTSRSCRVHEQKCIKKCIKLFDDIQKLWLGKNELRGIRTSYVWPVGAHGFTGPITRRESSRNSRVDSMRGMRNPKLKPVGISSCPYLSTDRSSSNFQKDVKRCQACLNNPYKNPIDIASQWFSFVYLLSIDWFKGKNTRKSHISWESLWFPVDFPLSQPTDLIPLVSPLPYEASRHPVAGDGRRPQGHEAPKTRHAFAEGLTTGAHRPVGLLPTFPHGFH